MIALALALALGAENPWVDAPDAPAPDTVVEPATGPREPGAKDELLSQPPVPPEPARPPVDTGLPADAEELRFATTYDRAALVRFATLDAEGALALEPGLWLRHEQAGAAIPSMRGLPSEQVAFTIDDVPVLTLGGLIAPLEIITVDGAARLDVVHGPRALAHAPTAGAGVLALRTGTPLRDMGEGLRVDGVVAGGYGGPDLEKGVLAAGETGWGRVRVSAHGSLVNREDQRQGRSFVPFAFAEPVGAPNAGVLERSGGSGGDAGVRVDVLAWPRLLLFTSWHSARGVEVPRPAVCGASDERGRGSDCVRTTERGVDLWLAGADAALDAWGVAVALRPRVSIQRALAKEERAGTSYAFVDTAVDGGVRGTGSLDVEAVLPSVALLDVWQPRVLVMAGVLGDRLESSFAARSLRVRDAEPPGEGVPDPLRARLVDGATVHAGWVGARLSSEGQVVALALSARAVASDVTAPGVAGRTDDAVPVGTPGLAEGAPPSDGRAAGANVSASGLAPQAELAARVRVLDGDLFRAQLFAAVAHSERPASDAQLLRGPDVGQPLVLPPSADDARFLDNTVELGARLSGAWWAFAPVLWASQRSGALHAAPIDGDPLGRARWVRGGVEQAVGVEARGHADVWTTDVRVEGALAGYVADVGAPAVPFLDVGDGGDGDEGAALSGVLNPIGALVVSWDPAMWPFGVFARSRVIVPHTRLAPSEELDRALCPELPSDDQVAAGARRLEPCSGAEGAVLLDVGAHVEAGRVRFDVVGENLLDREGHVRNEPIGTGGLAVRALVSIGL